MSPFRTPIGCFLVVFLAISLVSCGGEGEGGGILPTNMSLSVTATGPGSARLSWTAASTVTDYRVYMNGNYQGSSYHPNTAVHITTLTPNTRYCFRVYAFVFPVGAVSQSNEACLTTPASIKPSVPTGLSATAVSPGEIDLAWSAATGDFSGYKIYRDGSYLVSTSAVSYSDMSARPSTQYCYAISAYDQWGYESEKSTAVCATTPADTEAPSVPSAVQASYVLQGGTVPAVELSWQEAYDNSGKVPAYKLYRNGLFLAQTPGLSYTDTGVEANTQYCYTVTALDNANNETPPGGPACLTTSWTSATIDSTVLAEWTTIGIDAGDRVHIAYYDGMYTGALQQTGTVKYATNLSGAWQAEAIDSVAPWVYSSIALLVNTDGGVNVVYYDFGRDLLQHAVKTAGAWLIETIAADMLGVKTVGLAGDAAGRLHLIANPVGDVTYLSNATGAWLREVIGNNGVIYGGAATAAIAVDDGGNAAVGYYAFTDRSLQYASNRWEGWVSEAVDRSGDVGLHPAIALDAGGAAHLGYYDVANGDLKYATNATGGWVTETIDRIGDVGLFGAIAVDRNGSVHISYLDATNHALKYATNASGQWATFIIDGSAYVEGYTSIAIDSAGKIHISYKGGGHLRHATNR